MTRRPVCPIGPELFGILVTMEVWMCGTGLHCIKPDIGAKQPYPVVVAPAVGDIAVYCPGSVFLSGLLHFQPGFVTWTDIELPELDFMQTTQGSVCALSACLPIGSPSSGLAHYWFIEPVQEPYHDSQDWSLVENNRGQARRLTWGTKAERGLFRPSSSFTGTGIYSRWHRR